MRAVLGEANVSITSSVCFGSGTTWWLTRRLDGFSPADVCSVQRTGRCAKVVHERLSFRRGLLAVFTAPLCVEALRAAEAVASVDAAYEAWFTGYHGDLEDIVTDRCENVRRSLCGGAFSSGAGCHCAEAAAVECGTMCSSCLYTSSEAELFVEADVSRMRPIVTGTE
jgi:hypothetical protein